MFGKNISDHIIQIGPTSDEFRCTGRTTEMLNMALEKASAGYKVYVVMRNHQAIKHAMCVARDILFNTYYVKKKTQNRIYFPNRGMLYFVMANKEDMILKCRGNTIHYVYVDHDVDLNDFVSPEWTVCIDKTYTIKNKSIFRKVIEWLKSKLVS